MDPVILEFLKGLVAAGGPGVALIFAVMWWMERDERKKAQERERDLTREILKSTVKQTNAIRSLRYVFLHGRAPEPEEYEAEDVD